MQHADGFAVSVGVNCPSFVAASWPGGRFPWSYFCHTFHCAVILELWSAHAADAAQVHPYAVVMFAYAYPDVCMLSWAVG
jgi:hypothetical protein